jgi:hypothetical protein
MINRELSHGWIREHWACSSSKNVGSIYRRAHIFGEVGGVKTCAVPRLHFPRRARGPRRRSADVNHVKAQPRAPGQFDSGPARKSAIGRASRATLGMSYHDNDFRSYALRKSQQYARHASVRWSAEISMLGPCIAVQLLFTAA